MNNEEQKKRDQSTRKHVRPTDYLALRRKAEQAAQTWAEQHRIILTPNICKYLSPRGRLALSRKEERAAQTTLEMLARTILRTWRHSKNRVHSPRTALISAKAHARTLLEYHQNPPLRSTSIATRCDKLLGAITTGVVVRLLAAGVDIDTLHSGLARRQLAAVQQALIDILNVPAVGVRGVRPISIQRLLVNAGCIACKKGSEYRWDGTKQCLTGKFPDALRDLFRTCKLAVPNDKTLYEAIMVNKNR
jgi:hypothetical protein